MCLCEPEIARWINFRQVKALTWNPQLTAMNQMQQYEMTSVFDMADIHPAGEHRYTVNGTSVVAHGHVITPCNRTTISRRYALPCTTTNAHLHGVQLRIPGLKLYFREINGSY